MGYHFRAIGPAKSRELDNAKLAETPGREVGALITAGGKEDCKAILERKGLQLVKLNTQFCTYALLSPHIHKGMSTRMLVTAPLWSGASKAIWCPTPSSEHMKRSVCATWRTSTQNNSYLAKYRSKRITENMNVVVY